MTQKHTGETQRDEHAVIGGVAGKKVFVIDNVGNQITDFGGATAQNVKITESGVYTYIAKAPVGTAQSSAAWQAFRLDETSGMILLYADGNDNFDNVATDLTSLTYA